MLRSVFPVEISFSAERTYVQYTRHAKGGIAETNARIVAPRRRQIPSIGLAGSAARTDKLFGEAEQIRAGRGGAN